MPGLETVVGRRINALPAALDAANWPAGARVVRIAPDDVFLIGDGPLELSDRHAIVDHEAGFSGVWITRPDAADWLERNAVWGLAPDGEVAQGMAAGLPVKMLADGQEVLVLVASVLADDLEERLA